MYCSWQAWEENYIIILIRQIFNFSSILCSFKVVRILRDNPSIILAFLSVPLVTFVHPALGVISLLLFHAYHCHAALCSFLAASFRSQRKEVFDSKSKGVKSQSGGAFDQLLPLDEMHSNSPSSGKSFADTQLELFNYRHGLLILHLLAALMFVPSLVAWLQRTRIGHSFPWFVDSSLCLGIILHGLCGWKPDVSALRIPLPGIPCQNVGLNLVYLLAGYYCYLYALAGAPFRGIYAMAAVGVVSFVSWIVERRNREKCDGHFGRRRRHSHKH
ncbi:hypothetical protein Taro_013370 [Colocasia esculenta]|uniref:Uncharacterized protein n=1 Tax=Colocasia esculenta TaxID=4460 RepID=A0A843UFZ6_COLES|nr:hypothetical protein [Colocasia esculenta]